MVIRSIVYKDGEMVIGAGGAIMRLSDRLKSGTKLTKARRIVETVAEIERTFGVKNTEERDIRELVARCALSWLRADSARRSFEETTQR